MNLRYSSHARSQLRTIHDYLKDRNALAATRVIASLRASAERLTQSPSLGMKTDEGGVRLFIEPEYFYKLFYIVRDGDIVVVRILHRAQDW